MSTPERRIALTGGSDVLAERLIEALEASPAVTSCRRAAVTDANPLTEIDTLIHLGEPLREADPALGLLFASCAAKNLRQVVLISSAAVHEPSHHHPGLIGEERLAPPRRGNAIARGWQELERRAAEALAESETVLTVLRPAAVPVPGGRDPWSRLVDGRLGLATAGYDPSIQLLDPDDLAAAVRRVLEAVHGGTFHVAPAGAVAFSAAARLAGAWRLPVPHTPRRLGRLLRRRLPAPFGGADPDELDYLRYPWTVSGDKLRRELDFRAERSSAETAAGRSSRPGADAGRLPENDDHGMDRSYIARLGKTLFRFLHDAWWRIAWKGLERLPTAGGGVMVGVHRGHQPWDGVMMLHLLVRELGRYPRFLIHPTLVKFPFLAPYMIKCGGLHACRENMDWVLDRDGLLAVFPEGIRGAFRRYDRDVYQIGRFGSHEFIKTALRHQVPILPFVTVGSAEIFPIFGRIDSGFWKRFSEWPYFPITPTMGTVPLPSKWHTWFLEPIPVAGRYTPEDADDRRVIQALVREVRERMQHALDLLVEHRPGVFHGSIFDSEFPRPIEKEAT